MTSLLSNPLSKLRLNTRDFSNKQHKIHDAGPNLISKENHEGSNSLFNKFKFKQSSELDEEDSLFTSVIPNEVISNAFSKNKNPVKTNVNQSKKQQKKSMLSSFFDYDKESTNVEDNLSTSNFMVDEPIDENDENDLESRFIELPKRKHTCSAMNRPYDRRKINPLQSRLVAHTVVKYEHLPQFQDFMERYHCFPYVTEFKFPINMWINEFLENRTFRPKKDQPSGVVLSANVSDTADDEKHSLDFNHEESNDKSHNMEEASNDGEKHLTRSASQKSKQQKKDSSLVKVYEDQNEENNMPNQNKFESGIQGSDFCFKVSKPPGDFDDDINANESAKGSEINAESYESNLTGIITSDDIDYDFCLEEKPLFIIGQLSNDSVEDLIQVPGLLEENIDISPCSSASNSDSEESGILFEDIGGGNGTSEISFLNFAIHEAGDLEEEEEERPKTQLFFGSDSTFSIKDEEDFKQPGLYGQNIVKRNDTVLSGSAALKRKSSYKAIDNAHDEELFVVGKKIIKKLGDSCFNERETFLEARRFSVEKEPFVGNLSFKKKTKSFSNSFNRYNKSRLYSISEAEDTPITTTDEETSDSNFQEFLSEDNSIYAKTSMMNSKVWNDILRQVTPASCSLDGINNDEEGYESKADNFFGEENDYWERSIVNRFSGGKRTRRLN